MFTAGVVGMNALEAASVASVIAQNKKESERKPASRLSLVGENEFGLGGQYKMQ